MSSIPPPGGPARSSSIPNGPPSAGVNAAPTAAANPPPSTPGPSGQQNLNQIYKSAFTGATRLTTAEVIRRELEKTEKNHVLEYLSKKGYTRTEATLRKESVELENQQLGNGQTTSPRVQDTGAARYDTAFALLQSQVDDSLEVYRPELVRLLWPVFVHCFLNLVGDHYERQSKAFFDKYHQRFEREHSDDLRELKFIALPSHLNDSRVAKAYRNNKYRLSITNMAWNVLLQFLEAKEREGGSVISTILTNHLNIVSQDRSTMGNERSLAAMFARQGREWDHPAEDEGIPGHNPGSHRTDSNAPNVLAKLALGPLPMDEDAMEDVRAGLQQGDSSDPPAAGEKSLTEEFEQLIKKEPTDDAPTRDQVPLPPPLARDVAMEIQKVREHRDRFRIDPRSGGLAPGLSVCMYTFHNTFDSINCIDFSGDLLLAAAGTKHSYIRVWSLDGSPLIDEPTAGNNDESEDKPSSSRRLIGHSGPVYAVSFSPATAKPSPDSPPTSPRYLLSSSADKTIRLWSVEGWTPLVIYRGHDSPVWDVRWGPYGHYFLSSGHDQVARVWATEHISPLRMLVGHDGDVDCGCFHPNGLYVFTAGDKSIRMWEITRGNSVRMFTGHTGNITALECSPDGKTLASADDQGSILLWDLANGTLLKRMRGHGKGGIWSLSWSVESTVIASGGGDMTVRVWDATQRQPEKTVDGISKVDGVGATAVTTTGPTQKKNKKDVVVTPDQISVFPTKKSPVYKVYFSRSNLVLSASAYMPESA